MAKKSKRALADEAWRRAQQLEIPHTEPVPQERTVEQYDLVPTECPACHQRMSLAHGWALVFGDLLQCGFCSHVIGVPRVAYEEYGARLHAHFAGLSWQKPKSKRGPRARGAG